MPSGPPSTTRGLVFVDTETSGLDPAGDRIIEVGIVTLDGATSREWTTLINPRTAGTQYSRLLQEIGEDRARSLPRFRDVASTILSLLENRLLVAHNARFDYSFLKAEFERAGIHFEAEVVCSLSLSRKLYGRHDRHDLASLVGRHGLVSDVRHRALPDAQALFQLWQVFHRDHPREHIEAAIQELLAQPVLPPHLDATLIDRLPDKPGVYILHGNGRALHVGRAGNLRSHLQNFFRLDRISNKSLLLSNSIDDITWKSTSGELGARLQRAAMSKTVLSPKSRRATGGAVSWSFNPAARPALALTSLADLRKPTGQSFGLFQSERKARNALSRLADRHGLCRALLGVSEAPTRTCQACILEGNEGKPERLRHLTQAYEALLPWKVEPWPYDGPIAIRERGELHVIDHWRYLGTARGMEEIHALLDGRHVPFDTEVYSILTASLPRLPRRRVLPLGRAVESAEFLQ
jgi:DNA polymerase-3 subunit epsilon